MSAKERLEAYTQAARDLAVFDAIHKDFVHTREALEKRRDEMLDALKVEARQSGEMPENRYFAVSITPKVKRYFEADELVKMFPEVVGLDGVITRTADRTLVDHFVKLGIIPEEIASLAEREEPMTPAVSVKTKSRFGKPKGKTVKASAKKEA